MKKIYLYKLKLNFIYLRIKIFNIFKSFLGYFDDLIRKRNFIQNYFIFSCHPGKFSGGFGDRMVGFTSVILLAKILQKKILIYWTKDDLSKYLNYSRYDYKSYENNLTNKRFIPNIQFFDSERSRFKFLSRSKNPFKNGNYFFAGNREISSFLYKNLNILSTHKFENDFYKDIFEAYRDIYKKYFLPSETLKQEIENVTEGYCEFIGIQIRAGDMYFDYNNKKNSRAHKGLVNIPEEKIRLIFNNILNFLISNQIGNWNTSFSKGNKNKIYVTSDHPKAIKIAKLIFGDEYTFGVDSMPKHTDQISTFDISDFTKEYVDSIILSQKTKVLFISTNSNFGRVAALTSDTDLIYDYECNQINKKKLLSK